MTPEIEAEIRRRVEAFKASGKKLARGTYNQCVIGAIGREKAAEELMGREQSIALEVGFEGWESGVSALAHPDYYELGQKIAKENGL